MVFLSGSLIYKRKEVVYGKCNIGMDPKICHLGTGGHIPKLAPKGQACIQFEEYFLKSSSTEFFQHLYRCSTTTHCNDHFVNIIVGMQHSCTAGRRNLLISVISVHY